MIHIDKETCTSCKLCISICHTTCLSIKDNRVNINFELCSTCCQCVAICPTGALTWDVKPTRVIKADLLPGPDNLLELLKARRSIRKFKNQPIEEEKLESICQVAKLAPTNVYDIELVVICDTELIRELDFVAINFVRKANSRLYSLSPVYKVLKRLTPAVNDIDKVKTSNTLKRGSIFQGAPALIMVIADPRIPHSELSCQYTLYNMALMAQAMGIGSCVSGAGKIILSKNKEVRRKLNIPKNKRILGILFLGYPKVNFVRTVEGNFAPVRWFKGGTR